MSLDPNLKSRVLDAVGREPSPTRTEIWTRGALLVTLALAASLALFVTAGDVRMGERPLALIVATSLGTGLLAGTATFFAFSRGGSMLGRSRPLVGLVMIACVIALLLWKFGVSARYPGMTRRWADRPGLKCLGLGLALGVFPLVAALVARRRSDAVAPAATGAGFGAAIGLGATTAVDLWCPVAYMPHFLLGHVFPVAILATIGAVAGATLLSIRP